MKTTSFQEAEVARMLGDRRKSLSNLTTEFKTAFPELWGEFLRWWKDPEYIKLMGDDRVCTVCAALIHSGARSAHTLYHRQLSVALWSLQGAFLAHLVKTGDLQVEEPDGDFPEADIVSEEPKKPKKSKKKKKNREKELQA